MVGACSPTNEGQRSHYRILNLYWHYTNTRLFIHWFTERRALVHVFSKVSLTLSIISIPSLLNNRQKLCRGIQTPYLFTYTLSFLNFGKWVRWKLPRQWRDYRKVQNIKEIFSSTSKKSRKNDCDWSRIQ